MRWLILLWILGNSLVQKFGVTSNIYEPPYDKTNKVAVRPANSDQPGHPPSLIRVFNVRMKKGWILSYPLNTQRRL